MSCLVFTTCADIAFFKSHSSTITGLIGRERSDSGGSGSDAFDRQQQHPGHPHRGTPPMDPKMAWGQEVFPGGGEGRGLTSPHRQKQALEDDDVAKGPR